MKGPGICEFGSVAGLRVDWEFVGMRMAGYKDRESKLLHQSR